MHHARQPDELEHPYRLSSRQIQRFWEDGFIKLPGVLSERTIARFEPAVTRALTRENPLRDTPMESRSTYERAFIQVMNLWERDEIVRALVLSSRLARIAAELLCVEAVRLYHDQALYKEAGGGMTPWHADAYYWPLDTDRTVTAWIPLQHTPASMGPLAFARGSHRLPSDLHMGIGDESEERLGEMVERMGLDVESGPFAPGEVSFHHGFTHHRAAPNTTATPRRSITVIYMDARTRLAEPKNQAQRGDADRWCPGVGAGELCNSPLNPVVYPV